MPIPSLRMRHLAVPVCTVVALFALAAMPAACSHDDLSGNREPIAPDEPDTVYPEDPSMVDAPVSDSAGMVEELPDSLTNQPFAAATKGSRAISATDPAPSSAEPALPPPDDYAQQFQDHGIDFGRPGQTIPPTPGEQAAPSPKASAGRQDVGASSSGGKAVTRYIKTFQLNVRSQASLTAPVVQQLKGGTKISCVPAGEFCKIKDGQFVRTKYLSTSPNPKLTP